MIDFIIALCLLVAGYVVYGAFVAKVFGVDGKRPVPADTMRDNVDYMPLPTWRVFLIQFLNIAGLGPIFGAIMGVRFGPAAFLWIVFGTIFAGAVHDFISAMMSLRSGGESLPELVGKELGSGVKQLMRGFSLLLLVLVGAVFVLTPADLLEALVPGGPGIWVWIGLIFAYYILATLLPVDKVIGRIYPVFGFALLFMAAGLLAVLLFGGVDIPIDLSGGVGSRFNSPGHPVFPMMFVSIACGAISGFHATQSPMMARCLKNERLARPVFYGAMVAEGLVALIWAAAAIAFTGGYQEVQEYLASHNGAGDLVRDISIGWLGTAGGVLAILGVVAAPITTGDTALRSARLIAADFLHIEQRTITKRLLVSLPLFVVTGLLMVLDFDVLWRYFAWSNQTLAMFTLWAATVYLQRHGRLYIITLIPAMFMTTVCCSYLLYAPRPEGLGLDSTVALSFAIGVTAVCTWAFARSVLKSKCNTEPA
ncbi:MAG: carbon starvation protein A [Muribaculaceae bacterium]|nr:carbon starvation protein A [Muribaculaceae bacterium]